MSRMIIHLYLFCTSVFAYDVGTTYRYVYNIFLEDGNNTLRPEKQIETLVYSNDLEVTPLWTDQENILFKFELIGSTSSIESVAQIEKTHQIFYVHMNQGIIQELIIEKSSSSSSNLIRGIASLFQVKRQNWQGWEKDVSGNCWNIYSLLGSEVRKNKKNCQNEEFQRKSSHKDPMYDVKSLENSESVYKWKNDIIIDLEVYETLESYLALETRMRNTIGSKQVLRLHKETKTSQEIVSTIQNKSMYDVLRECKEEMSGNGINLSLETTSFKNKEIQQINIKNFLSSSKGSFKGSSLSSVKSAKAFLKAFKVWPSNSSEIVIQILSDKKNKDSLAQIMDILGSLGSFDIYKVVVSTMGPSSRKTYLVERFLWALSSSALYNKTTSKAHDQELIFQDMMIHFQEDKFSSNKLKETWITTLISLFLPRQSSKDLLDLMTKSLNSCVDEECEHLLLRALFSSRESLANDVSEFITSYLSRVLNHTKTSSKKLLLTALQVLSSLKKYSSKAFDLCYTLVQNDKEDNSVRIEALNVLCTSPDSIPWLLEILKNKGNLSQKLQIYYFGHLRHLSQENPELAAALLPYGIHYNWNVLCSEGHSGFLSRQLFSSPSANASFSLGVQMEGQLLKQSTLDVFVEKSSVLQLDIFAGGLSSFLSESQESDEEAANAGMKLSFLGNKIRPFIFFSSLGELMSLYWSGAAEQKTSVYQGNRKIHDHSSQFIFSSGLILKREVSSAISYDLSGQAIVSMWTKNGESSVETSFALVIESELRLEFPMNSKESIKTQSLEGRIQLILNSEFDFSSDQPEMCIQIKLPNFFLVHEQSTHIDETSTHHQKSIFVPGKTLFLNQKNNELCNQYKHSRK